jgi:hypothetical protein
MDFAHLTGYVILAFSHESTATRTAGGLDFTALGGKRQGREVPQIVENNAVKPGAKHPVWKTQLSAGRSADLVA